VTLSSVQHVGQLQIASNGTLNMGAASVFINYGSSPDPISSIAALIASGYAGGAWTGHGINSTIAQTNKSYGIGYADSADAGNPAGLASGTIEIAFTLLGDANLDGKVNGSDFLLMSSNFNDSGRSWDQGDFNYDGNVNGEDFVLMSGNFNLASQYSADATSQTTASNAPASTDTGVTDTSTANDATSTSVTKSSTKKSAEKKAAPKPKAKKHRQ